jgi:TRAP-type transport system periplasmic protein
MQAKTPVGDSFDMFKSLVEKESKGELKIDVFHGGILGSEIEATEQIAMGQIDIACIATTNYSGKSNVFQTYDLPYVFSGQMEWKYHMGGIKGTGGGLLGELRAYVLNKEGHMLLGCHAPGRPKVIANSRRAVKSPKDAKGLKIRVSPSPLEAALLKEWGFTPVPIPWPETFSAMQQKVVDGSVSGYLVGGQFGHFDICKYSFEPEAVQSAYMILMNGKKWKSLSPTHQDILLRAMAEATRWCWETIDDVDEQWKQKYIKEKHIEVYSPPPAAKAEWVKIAEQKVWPQYTPKVDQQVLKMTEKYKKEYQGYVTKKK